MANNISYNPNTGYNIPETLVSYFTPWQFSKTDSYSLVYVQGTAVPAPYNFNLKIKDFIASDLDSKYDSFRIKYKPRQFVTAIVQAITFTGQLVTAAGGYDLTQENLDVSFALTFNNMGVLDDILYRSGFTLEAYGIINGNEILLESKTFTLIVNVIAAEALVVNPKRLSMSYLENKEDPDPVRVVINSGAAFTIRINNNFTLSGGNVIKGAPLSEFIDSYSGSGSQELLIALNTDNVSFEGRTLQYIMYVDNGLTESQVELLIHQLTTSSIEVVPRNLSFAAVRNIFEAPEQELTVKTPSDFTISMPNWMEFTKSNLGLFVKPVLSANFRVGTYTGEIVITSAVDTVRIVVTHRIIEIADFNLDGSVVWCRDQDALSTFYSADLNAIATVTLEAILYNPNTSINKVFQNDYSLAFFQNQSEFHFGDIVKRLFIKPDNLNRFGVLSQLQDPEETKLIIYNPPAFVDLTYVLPGTQTRTESLKNIPFLDGRKPALFCEGAALLKAERIVQRVTRKSVALVNFYNKNLISTLNIRVNHEIKSSIELNAGSAYLYGKMIRFDQYLPGDRVRVELKSGSNIIEQDFIVFPDQPLTNHIAWLNEYQTQELLEFTGDWRFESEYEMSDFKRLGNLVEELQRVDTRKEMSLIINTGWIPATNQILIDEILMNKKAWLITADLKTIDLVPKSKKITNEDSENALYSYDVEFTINKSHDLKSHSSLI